VIESDNILYGLGWVGFNPQVKYLFSTSDGLYFRNQSLAVLTPIYVVDGVAIGNSIICSYGVYVKTIRHGWDWQYFYTFYISTKKVADDPSKFAHQVIDGPTETRSDLQVVFHESLNLFIMKYGDKWSSSPDGKVWTDITKQVLAGLGRSSVDLEFSQVGQEFSYVILQQGPALSVLIMLIGRGYHFS